MMPRPFPVKVNRVVTFLAAGQKPRPAIVTALNGAGSTTLSSASIVGATTLSTVATAAVNQAIIINDGAKTEMRVVSAVGGAGPFSLTVPALQYAHNSATPVSLQATSVSLRVRRASTHTTIAKKVNASDVSVWTPK
jgi:hypothetical protein